MTVSRPRLTSQAKKIQIIMNLYNCLRNQDKKESETDVEIRTAAAATGMSVRSLHRIKQQALNIQSPPQRTRISSVMGAVDDSDRLYTARDTSILREG